MRLGKRIQSTLKHGVVFKLSGAAGPTHGSKRHCALGRQGTRTKKMAERQYLEHWWLSSVKDDVLDGSYTARCALMHCCVRLELRCDVNRGKREDRDALELRGQAESRDAGLSVQVSWLISLFGCTAT